MHGILVLRQEEKTSALIKEGENKMKIQVQVKSVYGKQLVYPVSYKKELEDLTGKKTLDNKIIIALKNLGFTFETVLLPIDLYDALKN